MTIRASAGLYSLDRTTVLSWLTVLRPKAGAASGRTAVLPNPALNIGRRRRLCRALHMPLNGRGLHEWSYKGPVRPFRVFPSLGTPEPLNLGQKGASEARIEVAEEEPDFNSHQAT